VTVRPTFTGPAAVPVNLTLALTPATTSQASPGAQVLTATPTGGTGSIASYSWTATYVADGTSAAALLSGSGATRTITTTAPGQVVQVSVVATDSGSPTAQTAPAVATVAVARAAAATLTAPTKQTQSAPGAATVTFPASTGYGTLSYSATFDKPSGSAATLSGSGLGPYSFTTDVEGPYTVTLTVTDTDPVTSTVLSTAQATGIVSLVAVGAIWTLVADEDFTTYTAGSRSGNGTLALVKDATTRYTATLNVSSGTWSAGIDAGGLFITTAGSSANGCFTFPVTISGTEWYAVQWLMDIPTLSGTSVTARATLQSGTAVSSGTEFHPLIVNNNAGGGIDLKANLRLSGVAQTAGVYQTNGSNPGRVCVTCVAKDGQIYFTAHDSDDFLEMAELNDDIIGGTPLGPARNDTSSNAPSRWIPSPVNIGLCLQTAAGSVGLRRVRVFSAGRRVD
jgi:hypothetical protein